MAYDLGDLIRLSTVVKDLSTGNPTNTPTLSVAVVKPDETSLSPAPTVTNTGAGGVYYADIPASAVTQPGWWTYTWIATGTVESVDTQQFEVRAPRVLVASLEEMRRWVRIATDREDEDLRDTLTAVTDMVEPAVGTVRPATWTEWHELGGDILAPRRRPLVSVTSLTPDQGTAVDSSLYIVDTDLGIVRLRARLCGLHSLQYKAGHTVWPAALKQASKIICQHEWTVRNGTGGRTSRDTDALAMLPGTGYLIPNRALELMRPYLLPGVA